MIHASSRYRELVDWFKPYHKVIVAFSGGVDSSLVASAAHESLAEHAIAVTSSSQSMARRELHEARAIARHIGIRHMEIETGELYLEQYVTNPPDRCFYCKDELYRRLREIAISIGADVIVDGTNHGDLSDFRPGLTAKELHNVKSPLVELKFSKNDVRLLSAYLNLPTASKPSTPCLSSRVVHGVRITAERLRRVEEAEAFIIWLTGVKILRVRDHGEIARLEVGSDERRLFYSEDLMNKISEKLKSLGFRYVTMDLSGYQQGSSLGKEQLLKIESTVAEHV